MPDALRLALSVFTVVRIRVDRTDRHTAGMAMTMAPLVGAALGGVAAAVLTVASIALPPGASALLPAALAVTTLTIGSRLLHLDGLADTADAFGVVGADPIRARAAMKAPNVGAFGVVAIVLVLAVDVAALAAAAADGRGTLALLTGAATGRLAATWSCRPSVRAADESGLGAWVAGSVPTMRSSIATALTAAGVAAFGALTDHAGIGGAAQAIAGVVAGLVMGEIVRTTACRRVGGLTGDVLGATIEVAAAASLLAVAISVRLVH